MDINDPKTYSAIVNGYAISTNLGQPLTNGKAGRRWYKVYGEGVVHESDSHAKAVAFAELSAPGPHVPVEPEVEPEAIPPEPPAATEEFRASSAGGSAPKPKRRSAKKKN